MTRRDSFPTLLEVIKEQRQKPTPAEEKLWQKLRRNNLSGYKFRRQHPIAGYVIDFYCPRVKLGIEVDGRVHKTPEQKECDEHRSSELATCGVRIIRFWNSEIMNDMDSVLKKILSFLEAG